MCESVFDCHKYFKKKTVKNRKSLPQSRRLCGALNRPIVRLKLSIATKSTNIKLHRKNSEKFAVPLRQIKEALKIDSVYFINTIYVI